MPKLHSGIVTGSVFRGFAVIPQPPSLAEMYPGRLGLTTAQAAKVLGRAPQTLRKWATYQDGPLDPKRVNGRLSWPIADLQRLIG